MSELKEKTYQLVGDSFQLSYMLKSGKNKKLTIFDESDKKNKRNRAIRYCPNEASIYLDEQSEHAVVSAILFENKLLETKATEVALQKFLDVHPDNVRNGGTIFEELNPEAEAKESLEREEQILDIKSAIRKKEKEKDGIYELESLAAVLVGSAQTVKGKSAAELKQAIYEYVNTNPDRFIDEKGNVTIFDDSEITRKYIVLKAINEGVIRLSPDNKSMQWKDKGKILDIPRGVKAIDHFAEFLKTDEGLIILDEINKRF